MGDDVRFDDETEKVLRADNYLSRNFVSGGRAIFLCWLLCDATERRNLSQSAKLPAQFRIGHERCRSHYDYTHQRLVGAGATILPTSDGGMSWQTGVVQDGAGARFTATSFAGNSLGWAVGTAGLIFATTDGGLTWSEQHSIIDTDLFDVKFVDTSEGWAVWSQGTLLGTKDGGRHWLAISSGTSHALDRLFFVDRITVGRSDSAARCSVRVRLAHRD